MCNHYRNAEEVLNFVQATMPWVRFPEPPPQWRGHIYPKYPAPVIMQAGGESSLAEMRWGVWPFYAKGKPQFITNARNDGLLSKAAWKQSARHRRCLVPATGYFEPGLGPVGAKGEVLFKVKEAGVFMIAGLWDRDPDGSDNRGFTLVTTEPNGYAARFHDRMPVVLGSDQWQQWVGDEPLPDDQLTALCRGLPEEAMDHEEIAARPREKLVIKRPAKDSPPATPEQPTLL